MEKAFYEAPDVELLRFAAAQKISASDDELVDDGSDPPDVEFPAP